MTVISTLNSYTQVIGMKIKIAASLPMIHWGLETEYRTKGDLSRGGGFVVSNQLCFIFDMRFHNYRILPHNKFMISLSEFLFL